MKQTLIIGAGVMGLSIARQLNSKHRHIRIIDRSTPRMSVLCCGWYVRCTK